MIEVQRNWIGAPHVDSGVETCDSQCPSRIPFLDAAYVGQGSRAKSGLTRDMPNASFHRVDGRFLSGV